MDVAYRKHLLICDRKEEIMNRLNGTWYNEWGSRVELHVEADGTIQGQFHPAVGDTMGKFKLLGLADKDESHGSRSLGFAVAWQNESINLHSVTAWSGQFHTDNDEPLLVMTWLLTKETHPEDDWLSTFVGHDLYRHTPYNTDETDTKRRKGPSSHPFH
jgi:hypothetical protein